ncbi:MAG TPA: amidohydrolase/deacetylase family metallohydrolase, partial [Terriglobia bacterium]|nr:amidohydrolase/deacetylase family metallohydrolase [Terriglobia bacterium]
MSLRLTRHHVVKVLLLLFVAVHLIEAAPQQRYELLLKGGHVIDPQNSIDGLKDVAVSQGKIAAVADAIPASQAEKVVNVSGLYVVPGLIDLHTHLYATSGMPSAWAGDSSVLPDGFSFRTGATT